MTTHRCSLVLAVLVVLSSVPAFAGEDEPRPLLTHALLASGMVLQGADAAQSMYLLGQGGFREVNPVLRPLTDSPAAYGAVKLGIAAGSTWLLLRYHKDHPRLVRIAALVQTAVLTSVVIHNERVRRR